MKNKFSSIILGLYTVLLIIFAISNEFINTVNLGIANILSVSDPNNLVIILKSIETGLFFLGYGICLTIVCIDYLDSFRYIVIYSLLLSVLAVIVNVLIKSFYMQIDFINFIIMLVCVILGVVIEIIIKIKQVREEKNEE